MSNGKPVSIFPDVALKPGQTIGVLGGGQLARMLGIRRPEAEGQVRAAEYRGRTAWQASAPEDHRATVKEV